MSRFPGPINELERVSVDNFVLSASNGERSNRSSTCFFLSHCHTDHMNGLREDPFIAHLKANPKSNVYCSSISKLILSTFPALEPVMHQVIALSTGLNIVRVLPSNGDDMTYSITVSLIPAGHCPGSVMFLFETPQHTILYTGDFRLAVGDVAKFKQLHNGKAVKKISKIYFDATFFHESYWQFLGREDSIAFIIKRTKEWLEKAPENSVRLDMTANYGGEHIIKKVSEAMKCRVHVLTATYNLYQKVRDISENFTEKCRSTRIHVQSRSFNHTCLNDAARENILIIKPKAAPFRCKRGETPVTYDEKSTNLVAVNYSSHSSYSEIIDFLKYLRPNDVHACTDTYHCSAKEQEETIARLLSSWREPSSPARITTTNSLKRRREVLYEPIKIVIPTFSSYVTDKDLESPPLS